MFMLNTQLLLFFLYLPLVNCYLVMMMEILGQHISFGNVFHARIKIFGLNSEKSELSKFVLKLHSGSTVTFLVKSGHRLSI